MSCLDHVNRGLTRIFLALIRLYQLTLSPYIGGHCKFHPTCSRYAAAAIKEHGPWQGSWLALRRLLRCGPNSAGGLDPVPPSGPTRRQRKV